MIEKVVSLVMLLSGMFLVSCVLYLGVRLLDACDTIDRLKDKLLQDEKEGDGSTNP